jgi:HORMA domain
MQHRSFHCFHLVEVAIHTILYVRQVYPADIFVRRKKYDTPVFQSRHPSLNEYISGAVKAIGEELVRVSVIYIQFLHLILFSLRVKLTKL